MKKISILLMLMALFGPLAMMGQTTLLNEDFNSLSTDNSIPSSWDNSDGTTSNASYKWCYTSSSDYNGNGATVTTGHNGTKCVRFDSYYNSRNNTNFLKTPVLDLSSATAASLTFWYKNPAGGDFSVYISTDGGSTYTTSLVTGLTGQSSWTSRTISLNSYVGAGKNNVVIVFKGTSNWGSGDAYIYLDDVTVDATISGSCANGCECFEDCTALTNTSLGSSGSTPAANLPSGWKGYGTSYYPYAATFTSYMGDDADGQFMYFKSTTTGATYLALPDQYVSQVNFDYAYETNAYSGLSLEIGYMTDISNNDWYNNTFYSIKTMTNNGDTWGSETADFSSVPAFNYYVVFKFSQSYSSWYSAAIDNVCLTISVPSIALNPTSATVFTGFTQTLTATTENVHGTPTITYTSSNTSVATVSGSGTSATVTAVSAGTATITATMTVNGTPYTAQCAITVEDPSYCDPVFSNPIDDYIQNFVTTGGTTNISNSSTYETGGYSDYYSTKSASITAGETLSCTVTPSSTSYKYGHAIWVDWNKDYEFSSTEKVAYSASSATGNWTGTFTIPANTAAGDYRMRVIHQYTSQSTNPATDPCVSTTYGEAEDYKLTVLASGAYTITCATTTGGTITADKNNADENDVITVTATPETDYLLTALTYTPEGGSAQNIDITSTPYTFTMPAANVTVNATFTLPTCPRPTNLTVSNLAASHATVSWDSEAGNYTVKYSTATVSGSTLDPIFEDGFESGLGSWTTYALDYQNESSNWHQQNATTLCDGNNNCQENHSGDYVAMSRSYIGGSDRSVDNWLITPQMTLGDVVKFWIQTNGSFPDAFAVYVSTGSNTISSSSSIGDFEQVLAYENATGSWAQKSIDISAYAGQTGYIAIRHTTYGGDFLSVDDFGVYNTINTYSYGGWTTVSPNPTTESCQITGLSAETLYEVQVQANCGGTDGSSAWSTIHFTTPDNCGAPQELASSNVTATSATLSWADDKDSYNLRYRKVYFYEGFEGGTMPTGWTAIDANNDGLTWSIGYTTVHSGSYGAYDWSYVYSSDGSVTTTPDDYLISPLLDLQGTLRVWLSGYGSNATEHYAILLSTTGNSASDFTTTLLEGNTTAQYAEVYYDLSSYEGQQGYIAIRHYNCTDQRHLYVDDFGLYGSENWVTLSPNPTTETANLTGLSMNTTYEWQVQGVNCDGNNTNTDWSAPATFTTPEGYALDIVGYTSSSGWYLISSPVGTVNPEQVTSMITAKEGNTNTYDLFMFDQTAENEWLNWRKQNSSHYHFDLEPGTGYLYANKNNVTLVFTGPAYTGNGTFPLDYSDSNGDEFMHGWNLVGNPYAELAEVNRAYYTLDNESFDYAIVEEGSAQIMEGIFVKVEENETEPTVTFTPESQKRGERGKGSSLTLNITKGGKFVDRAIVGFGQGQTMPKFQFNRNHTKVYIPQDGQDYALVRSEEMGEMPVNFKAENDGTYSLSFSSKNAEFAYLHLIDNMTGKDIDMLQTPSYSFEAKTTDYESRFKLVFATGDNSKDENFAFFSNGSFVINNEGEATLQVIDIMGRIIKSESINGCTSVNVNAAPGVYMLRLVNGNNVKVQKVIVK